MKSSKFERRLSYEQEILPAHLYTSFGYRFQHLFSTFAAQLKLAATIIRNTNKYSKKQPGARPNELYRPGVTPNDQKEFTNATPSPVRWVHLRPSRSHCP